MFETHSTPCALQASYSYEVLEVEKDLLEDYSKLTKNEVLEELTGRGVEACSTSSTKQELLEVLLAELRRDNESTVDKPPKVEVNGRNLHAKFTCVSCEGLELELTGLGIEEKLTLPHWGPSSPKAVTAALCASAQFIQDMADTKAFQQCLARAASIPCAPGTLELLRGGKGIGILHEASSSKEMKEVLKIMEDVKDPNAKVTVVFGCDGEVSRGDRAKFAWALADCDRIVLTSASPGVEPPMQVIEDVLEAIRGFRSWTHSQPAEIFVVVDRADAIKLATMSPHPSVTLLFGSSMGDSYQATDEFGKVKSWLFSDGRLLTEALHLQEELEGKDGRATNPPWMQSKGGKKFLLPGQSLHWSYGIEINADGQMHECL